jgi:uncharacterized membrane protein (UPF0127 family)
MVVGASILIATALGRWASDGFSDDVATVGSIPDASGTLPIDESGMPAGMQPDGFTTIRARITDANGDVCEVCLWLADDGDERGRGLMGVTDLGDAVGMAFVFDDTRRGSFWMFQTPTPLSIAWFAGSGDELVGTADMEPCIGVPRDWCERYSPASGYDLAIEVPQGGLEALGITAGSRVRLIEGTEAERCPIGP